MQTNANGQPRSAPRCERRRAAVCRRTNELSSPTGRRPPNHGNQSVPPAANRCHCFGEIGHLNNYSVADPAISATCQGEFQPSTTVWTRRARAGRHRPARGTPIRHSNTESLLSPLGGQLDRLSAPAPPSARSRHAQPPPRQTAATIRALGTPAGLIAQHQISLSCAVSTKHDAPRVRRAAQRLPHSRAAIRASRIASAASQRLDSALETTQVQTTVTSLLISDRTINGVEIHGQMADSVITRGVFHY